MKKLFIVLFVLSMFSFLYCIIFTNNVFAEEIRIPIEFPEPILTPASNGYWHIEMNGMRSIANPGEPVLPVKGVKALIPYNNEIKSYHVELGRRIEQFGSYKIEPGQKEYPLSYEGKIDYTQPKKEIYKSAGVYPAKRASDKFNKQRLHGYEIAVINLHPVEYTPISGKIAYYDSMTLVIKTQKKSSTAAPFINRHSPGKERKCQVKNLPRHRKKLLSLIDNPQTLDTYNSAVDTQDNSVIQQENSGIADEQAAAAFGIVPSGDYRYVIITAAAFENVFQALVNHKILKGIMATIVTTEWIYANYDGTRPDGGIDNATKIRNFIIDAYENWNTEYVLLAGDGDGANLGGESEDSIIPARCLRSGGATIAADLYYACLDGSFDNDQDGEYGEENDGIDGEEVDLVAEVYVGRAPVDSISEAENFVNKTIQYDEIGGSYLQQCYMLGEYLWVKTWGADYMEEIRLGSDNYGYSTMGFIENEFFNVKTHYDKDNPPVGCHGQELVDIINNEVHILNHVGHCNNFFLAKLYVPDKNIFESEEQKNKYADVNLITNENPFFMNSQGCYPGAFDNKDAYTLNYLPDDCIAEHLLGEEKGAFALIVNSRYGWGILNSTNGPSQYYQRQFWDAVFREGILELGRANQDSKEDNIEFIDYGMNRYCYFTVNLLGDPQLQLHVSIPDIDFYLSAPLLNSCVKGTIDLIGTVDGNKLDSYELYYWEEKDAENKILLGKSFSPVNDGRLGVWDTTECVDGNYVLGVRVITNSIDSNAYWLERAIKVDNVNEPPVFKQTSSKGAIANDVLHPEEPERDVYLLFSVSAEDPDDPNTQAGTLVYSAENIPRRANFNADTGSFSWAPLISDIGRHTVTLKVQDSEHLITQNIDIYVFEADSTKITGTNYWDHCDIDEYQEPVIGKTLTYKVWQKDLGSIGADNIIFSNMSEIVKYNINEPQEPTRISDNGRDTRFLAVSQNRIVWNTRDYSNYEKILSDILIHDLESGQERQITNMPAERRYINIEGNYIVWQDKRNGNWDIYMYNIADGAEVQVTDEPCDQKYPGISGNRIVWQQIREKDGYWDIYMYDITTGVKTQITDSPFNQQHPCISGNRIVWSEKIFFNWHEDSDIFMYDIASGQTTQITNDPAAQDYPIIKGDMITWLDHRSDDLYGDLMWDIYMYNLNYNIEVKVNNNMLFGDYGGSTNPTNIPVIYDGRILWAGGDYYNDGIYVFNMIFNTPPEIFPVFAQEVFEEKPVAFYVRATDNEGDELIYNAQLAVSGELVSTLGASFTTVILGDFNQDGRVDMQDWLMFSSAWGAVKGDENYNAQVDLDSDGKINILDQQIFSTNWGTTDYSGTKAGFFEWVPAQHQGPDDYELEFIATDNHNAAGKGLITITVYIQGDFNKDGRVDMQDWLIFSSAWGAVKGDENYLPDVDLNNDGKIDMLDQQIFSSNWGRTD
ncbi:MAG: C25 family cysteine peptidase [Candidatus Omnitrophota bacterium]